MARPVSRIPATPTAALGRFVLGLLVEHALGIRAEPWRFGPVVLVSAAPAAATAVVRDAFAGAVPGPPDGIATWDGTTLDREIAAALVADRLDRLAAALAGHRVVVVDRLDRVADPERQQALVHLLDAGDAAGTAWCVSVAAQPPEGLMPQCGSRLCGGLVVPLPTAAENAPPTRAVSIGRVLRAVARHHDLAVPTVVGPSRTRSVAAARSLAMYLARSLTGLSFHAIGAACGGRDHTTVLHGVRVCAERMARDPAFAAEVGGLLGELAGASAEPPRPPQRRRSAVGSRALAQALANRRRRRRHPA